MFDFIGKVIDIIEIIAILCVAIPIIVCIVWFIAFLWSINWLLALFVIGASVIFIIS